MSSFFNPLIGGSHYGTDYDDVLMFDTKSFDWKKIGSMKTERKYHAASIINIADVINFCS